MVLFPSSQELCDKLIDLIGSSNLTENLALEEQGCQDDFAGEASFLGLLTKHGAQVQRDDRWCSASTSTCALRQH